MSGPPEFRVDGRVAAITGGAGMLGREHAIALLEIGATVVLLDLDQAGAQRAATSLNERAEGRIEALALDITDPAAVEACAAALDERLGRVDILVNNAANDPKVESGGASPDRLESFSRERWDADLAVGLTGAFLCSQAFGRRMAERRSGVILNVASDLAVIAPDQRLYRVEGQPEESQPAKAVSYSVVKSGLVGLTRYLATYWAGSEVRANALSPGGVFDEQPPEFVARVEQLIPLGRMAQRDEYHSAVQFLCSDASRYMTGQNLVMDGGRSVW
ncbi:MAG: SDR family oxidoreductase [Actinobacteria bacterium]|nr:MAG: SDR family oxidoreductase [Actinomycetota bacterium]